MNIKKPMLILTMFSLSQRAREILCYNARESLVSLGFNLGGDIRGDLYKQRKAIIVGYFANEPRIMTIMGSDEPNTVKELVNGQGARVFDVVTDLEAFFRAVDEYKEIIKNGPVEVTLEGVECVITRDGVVINNSALMKRVEAQAHAIRAERFGT